MTTETGINISTNISGVRKIAVTEEPKPPICEKHGCEKRWIRDRNAKAGGAWRCNQCMNELHQRRTGALPQKKAVPKNGTSPICDEHHIPKVWHNNRAHPSGGQWNCPTCHRKRGDKWIEKNPVRKRELNDQWKIENPDKDKASKDHYREKNPEKCIEAGRKFRKENPIKSAASSAEWKKKNPEKNAAKEQRRRASKLNALVPNRPVTSDTEIERKALFDGCCFCGADKKLTLEHMVPLSKGGLHVEENLLGSCKSCNSSKHNHPVEDWFRKQPFFSEQRWQKILEVTATDD